MLAERPCNLPIATQGATWEQSLGGRGRGAGGAADSRKSMQIKGRDCAKASRVPGLFMAVSSTAGWGEGSRREDGGSPMSTFPEWEGTTAGFE